MAQPLVADEFATAASRPWRERLAPLLALARPVAFALLTLLAIIVLTYVSLAMARGEPLGAALSHAARQTPQYVLNLARGELGMTEAGSLTLAPVAVGEVVREAIPKSFVLLGVSLLLATLIGVPLGMLAAHWRHGNRSVLILLLSLVGVSIPSFFAAVVLQRFVITWQSLTGTLLVPVGGFGWDDHIVLPALVLAARPVAQITRITFLSLRDVIEQDYVRTARAKGLSAIVILARHMSRNALIPILTTLGVSLRFSLSSLPVVEFFFGWPGAGSLLLKSIGSQDDNLTLPLVLSLGALFVLVNLLLEISYPRIDPRLRERAASTSRSRTFEERLAAFWAALRDALRDNPLAEWWAHRQRPPEPNPFRELARADGDPPQPPLRQRLARRLQRGRRLFNLPLIVGGMGVGVFAVFYLFGPSLAPHSPHALLALDIHEGVIRRPPLEPDARFLWGTDPAGRDIMSLIFAGAQQTLTLAGLAVVARLLVGTLLGLLGGWWSGSWLDRLISGVAEIIAAFPALLFAMLLILALGIRGGMRPFIIAFCIVGWGEIMQYVRGEVMAIRPKPWIESAVAVGLRTPGVMLRHVLPNLLPALIALAALEMGAVLMLLGELGFLSIFIGGGIYIDGIGLIGDLPEWGSLLANVRLHAVARPWIALYPSMAFFLAILAFNLFGEGLRRLTDRAGFRVGSLFNRYTLVLALLAFLAVGWLQDNTGAIAVYKQQARAVEGAEAVDQAERLSDPAWQGRALGTPGMGAAADYIAEQFQALGLQAAGEELTYFQSDTRDYQVLDGPPSFEIEDGGHAPTYREDYAAYPAPFRNLGQGRGVVRFFAASELARGRGAAGGNYYSALDGIGSADEVLLVLSEEDLFYAARLPHQGILMVVDDPAALGRRATFSPLPREQAGIYSSEEEDRPMLLISEAIADRLLEGTGHSVAELRQQRDALGYDEVLHIPTEATVALEVSGTVVEREPVVNVIGHWPGKREDEDHRLIMVLAPYDSPPPVPGEPLSPAANDNASGVALMLELIRAMQESDYQPYRTYLFVAYSGEGWENGRYAIDPLAERFLQARQGFANAFEIEAVVHLRGLGTGTGDALSVSSGGSLRLAEQVERSARRMGVPTVREPDQLDLSIIYDWTAQYRGEGEKLPTVRLHWQGWEQVSRTTADTPAALSAETLEQAGEAIALTLMVIAREAEY